MTYTTSQTIARSEIPLIDISDLEHDSGSAVQAIAHAMLDAAERVGFFYVVGHGVDASVFERANASSRTFFHLPSEEKASCSVNRWHRGHLKVGEAKMHEAERIDLKESFVFGLELPADDPDFNGGNEFLGHNHWPNALPQFREDLVGFFEATSGVAENLMRAFAVAMGLPERTFIATADRPISRGSSVYYPPQPPNMGHEQFGVAPHTDYGCLTLVWQDDTGGLEVQSKAGEWLTAHPIENALVVNVGDLLARWTNDRFKSTPHRVVNRSGRERYSMALFWDPNASTVVDPNVVCAGPGEAKYESVSVGDYVLARLDESFAYRESKEAKG